MATLPPLRLVAQERLRSLSAQQHRIIIHHWINLIPPNSRLTERELAELLLRSITYALSLNPNTNTKTS